MIKQKRSLIFGIIGFILLLLAGLFGTVWYYATLPERISQHETLDFGQSTFAPGSDAAMRVIVRDTSDGQPLSGAMINVRAESSGDILFSGSTDENGTADLQMKMPDFDGMFCGPASHTPSRRDLSKDSSLGDVCVILERLRGAGCQELAFVDLSRSDIDVHVVRVVAPQLGLILPGHVHTRGMRHLVQ